MMMVVAIVPLLGAVGLAVDFAALSAMKADLQNATDAAVIDASRYYEANRKLPSDRQVREFLASNYSQKTGKPNLYVEGSQIWLEAESSYQPYFMSLFSSRTEWVAVTSATPLSKEIDMEIVLALDTTFSMVTDDKIGGLKTAASNFVNVIFDASTDYTRIKVGLVPFGRYVNVGVNNRNANWMAVPEDANSTGEEQCETRPKVIGETNCRMQTYHEDGVVREYRACDPVYGTEEKVCWIPSNTTEWRGCVGSRKRNLKDDRSEEPFPGIMNVSCSSPLAPLTTARQKLLDQIAGFRAEGSTYIVDGVMWGQRVLSPQLPFTEGVDPKNVSHEVRKIMVLMTDGENTLSADLPKYPTHDGGDRGLSDDWTRKACRDAAKNGIEIFTITFGNDVPNAAKKIMERCAASAEHYFDAASSGNLDEAFRAIAGYLTRIRLTH